MVEVMTTEIRRPQRWDKPFGPDMTDADVERILALEPFASMDPDRFPANASLPDVIRNDTRLIRYQPGDIVLRAGDYGTSAFMVVSGAFHVILPPGLPDKDLGRKEPHRMSLTEAVAQLWRRPSLPEVRDPSRYAKIDNALTQADEAEAAEATGARLSDIEDIIERYRTTEYGPGEMFGEIGALTRMPRTATVFAETAGVMLEIRRPGVHEFRRRDAAFKEHLDRLYRERSLEIHLRESGTFRDLDEAVISEVVERTLFETYGTFDWQQSFMRVAEGTPEERIAKEPVIAREGEYPDGLLMVRAGFARVSEEVDNGHRTIAYIGPGALFGLEELYHNWKNGDGVPLQRSLRSIGYTDILRVPTHIVERLVLPNLPDTERPAPTKATHAAPEAEPQDDTSEAPGPDGKGSDGKRSDGKRPDGKRPDGGLDVDLLEFMVDNRFINGTQTMLIDLDRCVRCDACVEACAVGHNNNPRFNRHGRRVQNLMVANACMHCNDPICMIGCPTGAIHRVEASGQVVVNDDTCIGCANCANNCPYNNIRMVEIRNDQGHLIRDEVTGVALKKSTKCDLCVELPGGPACQRACPHDALVRMDMSDTQRLADWLNR